MFHHFRAKFLSAAFLLAGLTDTVHIAAQDALSTRIKHDLYGDELPKGAIARLGTARFRHGSHWIQGLEFSPDASTLIVPAGDDASTIFFFEASTGRLVRKISTAPLSIRGFALSRDGQRIAVGGFWYDEENNRTEGQVWIIDTESGAKLQTIARPDRDMDRHPMVFSPDGKLLISVGTAGHIYVDDVTSGVEILRQLIPRDNSPSLAMSPDGTTLAIATGSNTGKFLLWKWQAGEEPKELKIVGTRTRNYTGKLAFSPNGKRLVTCLEHGDFPIQIWDVATGELLHHVSRNNEGVYSRGTLIFSPDGKNLLVPGWRSDRSQSVGIQLFDPATGEYQGEMSVPAGGLLAISRDGQLLASTSDAGVRVWKWPRREEVMPNTNTHTGAVSFIETPSSETIVTASDDGTIRVWDAATHRQLRLLQHDNWIRDIAVSPDGSQLASTALDDTVRLWNLDDGREIYRLPGHGKLGGVRAVGFASDGKSFLSFGDDFYLRRWDVRTGKALTELKVRPTGVTVPKEDGDDEHFELMRMNRAIVSPNASFLGISADKLLVLDPDSTKELQQLENPGSHIAGFAFSPDGKRILASAWGKPVQIKMADGRTRFSSEKNNPITMWNAASGEVLQSLVLPDGGAGPVAFSRDGNQFAVCLRRPHHSVAIFETKSGNKLKTIENLSCNASAVGFTYDGKGVIAGLADGTAVIWSLTD